LESPEAADVALLLSAFVHAPAGGGVAVVCDGPLAGCPLLGCSLVEDQEQSSGSSRVCALTVEESVRSSIARARTVLVPKVVIKVNSSV
jgi:hypothetical protein